MGFCQFGCDFPNFRNLYKTFLRYSRKVVSSFVRSPCFVSDWQWFWKFGWKSIKSMYYSTWVFVNLGAIFRIFETYTKRSLGTPRKVVSSFVRTPSFVSEWQGFLKFGWKSIKSMYYSTWVFVNLGAIFRIFETYPKRSLGTPERLWVVSSEAHVSFENWQGFLKFGWKSIKSMYYKYMGFCQFGCDFPNFRNLSKTFLRYSRKVVSSFVSSPCFVSDWQFFWKFGWKSIKSMYYSTWVFVNLGASFPNFRNLSKTFLRYSRKVVSSFVRSPCFVSDWQWFLKIWLKIN